MRGFTLLLSLALSGCGFSPQYGSLNPNQASSGANLIAAIQVAPIPDRIGQIMQNALIDRLTPRGVPDAPDYELRLALEEEREGFGVEPDREVTRERLRLTARYFLIDLATGEAVVADQARTLVSYDIVQSDFATLVTREDNLAEAAETLVEDIVARLARADLSQAGYRTE